MTRETNQTSETERWRRLEQAVDEILDGEASEISDDPLKRHVAAVLSSETGSPIDRSLGGALGQLLEHPEILRVGRGPSLGEAVGPYRIESILGEGGMGTVFLARRADGSFDQEVALKVLYRPGTDPNAVERFLRERQILAGLKHPNIAKLFDGGMVDGLPYLVMERIDGVPLTDYCEAKALEVEQRLALVVQTCDALHAAHRQGVVHRDLKPSNLLVEDDEGSARVVVVDFGIARVADSGPAMTATGQVFGTPGYMAPEQAMGRRFAPVDRRTDVFSLGVVLYELLSGRRPFEGDSAAEILGQVIESDPIPLRRWRPALPADVLTIVETCLAREPGARYDSMRALAEDLENYLDGRPIRARPVGPVGRWLRRARRHPRLAALVAGAAALALVSLVAVAFLAVDRAQTVKAERNAALAARAEAEDLLDFMLQDLHEGLERVGRLDLLEQVARRSVAYFEGRPATDAASVVRRTTALRNAAQILSAQGDHERAFDAFDANRILLEASLLEADDPELQAELARSLVEMASMRSAHGDASSALVYARRASEITQRLDLESSLDSIRLRLDALSTLGWVQRETEGVEAALATLTSALVVAEEGARGAASARAGESQAEVQGEGADWRYRVALARSNLGLVRTESGDYEGALADFTAARSALSSLAESAPGNTVWGEELQLVLARIAYTQLDAGQAQSSAATFLQAREQAEALLRIEPDHVGRRRELAVAHGGRSAALRELGRLDEAIDELDRSLAITRDLMERFPDNESAINDLAWDLLELGRIQDEAGRSDEATASWKDCVALLRSIDSESASSNYYLDTQAQALIELGRIDEARPLVERLLADGWAAPDLLELAGSHGLVP